MNVLIDDLQKLGVSMALGMAIGIERELNEKPAGLKTNVLICLGSALFTLCSIEIWGSGPHDYHIPAQIVTGIGFLGAGAILREGEQITGLTTAATIWVNAAIGMAVGMGFEVLAGIATLGILVVQVALGRLDTVVDQLRQRRLYRIVSPANDEAIEAVVKILKMHRLKIMRRKVMKRDQLFHSEWWTYGTPTEQERVIRDLIESDQVIEVLY